MLKRTVKRGLSRSLGRATAGDPSTRVVILCYHSIHGSLPFASASPALFREHVESLAEWCDLVRLSEVSTLVRDPGRSRPAVALTFDDGYRDNHTHALPVLEDLGASATFFVTAGLLERDRAVVARIASIRRASEADVEGLLWEQARELAEEGHEIGSHTWSHPTLSLLDAKDATAELTRSKAVIEERLGRPVTSLAYPFGKPDRQFTRETERLAEGAGYALAVAVLFRSVRVTDSPFRIPRFFVTQDDVGTLAAKVSGRWDWLGLWQERAPGWLARRVSPADFRDLADGAA